MLRKETIRDRLKKRVFLQPALAALEAGEASR